MTPNQRSSCSRTRRAGLALLAALAAVFAAAHDAQAQFWPSREGRGPWCAEMGGGAFECDYYSFEQCMARASGVSNACFPSPYYVAPPPPQPRQRRARHK